MLKPARYLQLALAAVTGMTLAGCGLVTVNNSVETGASGRPVQPHTQRLLGVVSRSPATAAVDAQVPASQLFTGRWFAPSSPWNTTIDNLPTAVDSRKLINASLEQPQPLPQRGTKPPRVSDVHTHAGVYINISAWTDTVVQGGVETRLSCRQVDCGPGNAVEELPIPRNVSPNPVYDGWFTIISPTGRVAYDLWRARRLSDGSISYQFMRTWNLRGDGYGQPGQAGARGSGLPLFAGLIRPAELEAGQVEHALAISLPSTAACFYVRPASTTDGTGSTHALPEGARLRLKADIRVPAHLSAEQKRYASALLWTLHNYGAIVVGQASVPTLYAQGGVSGGLLKGSELQWLRLNDFEAVQLPSLQRDPWSEPAVGRCSNSAGATQ